MAILDLKPFFSEHHLGQAPYLHIFSKAMPPSRDAAIRDDDRAVLADAVRKSARHQSIVTIFSGDHQGQKVLQINQLCYQTGQTLCLIDCAQLTEKYIGETEKNIAKLIADAENKNWILFFDEADALFATAKPLKSKPAKDAPLVVKDVLKYISQYQGLSVLNVQQKQHLSLIEPLSDYVIRFNQ